MSNRISIITVTYNSKDVVENALESVERQNYEDYEYIVVDGGSTDGTIEIVKNYKEIVSNIIREPDDGLYDAMNKGLSLATGSLVWYLNSDDRLTPGALETVADVYGGIGRSDECIIHGGVRRFSLENDLSFVVMDRERLWKRVSGQPMPISMPFNHPATAVSRSLMEEVGGFDTRFTIAADFDLFWRILEREEVRVEHVDQCLAEMALGGASESWRHLLRRMYEDHQIRSRGFPVGLNLGITLQQFIRSTLRTLAHSKVPSLDKIFRKFIKKDSVGW